MGVQAAPIGAEVFTFERRKHSGTRVYDSICRRDPVDTCIAVDKLEKSKKGFNFERFAGFKRFRAATSSDTQPIAEKPSEGREEEGMRGPPVRTIRRGIGSPVEPAAQQHFATYDFSRIFRRFAQLPEPGAIREEWLKLSDSEDFSECAPCAVPRSTRCTGKAAGRVGWQVADLPPFSIPQSTLAASYAAPCRQVARRSDYSDYSDPRTGVVEHAQRFGAGRRRNAAQPLQYSMGEGWDDRLTPQDLAGRAFARSKEEETAR